jgi:hypothetical protein
MPTPTRTEYVTVAVNKAIRSAGRNLDLWSDGFF